jgi:hypothetical protein
MSITISGNNRQTHSIFRKTMNRRKTSESISGMEAEFRNDEVTLRNQTHSEPQYTLLPSGNALDTLNYPSTTHRRNDGPESPHSENDTVADTPAAR